MLMTVLQIQSFDEGTIPGSCNGPVDPGGACLFKLHSNMLTTTLQPPLSTTYIHKHKLSFEMFILLLEKRTFLKLWVEIIYMEPFPFLILGK